MGTRNTHGDLVGVLQDLEQLLGAGWPHWGNTMALESYFSNKSSLSYHRPSLARDIFRAWLYCMEKLGHKFRLKEGEPVWLIHSF